MVVDGIALLSPDASWVLEASASEEFTSVLLALEIKISMDGKGRCIDNIFVERLWRSLKYEEVYLYAYDTVQMARAGIAYYFDFFNDERPHKALGYQTDLPSPKVT